MITKRALSSHVFQMGMKFRPAALAMLEKYVEMRSISDINELEPLLLELSKYEFIDEAEMLAVIKMKACALDKDTDIAVLDVLEDLVDSSSFLSVAHEAKGQIYRRRFSLIQKQVLSNPSLSSTANPVRLTPVDGLLGARGEKLVLGMLIKLDGKTWYLEDLDSHVKLNLGNAVPSSPGLFCEGCIVLVHGEYIDGVFCARSLMQPPLGTTPVDSFGAAQFIENHSDQVWKCMWPEHSLIVAVSDLHLDDSRSIYLFEKLLAGYSSFEELTFVLMGNFSSEPVNNPYKYQSLFSQLFSMIEKYPNLQNNARWIVLPGPKDPGIGQMMPRHKLPSLLTQPLEALPHFKSLSNPTRIQYCGKKFVFGRVDQFRSMQRCKALNLSDEDSNEMHLAQTLVKQGHLCPCLFTRIIPECDPLLYIHEAELVCVGENYQSFQYNVEGTVITNPGHFSRFSSFTVISPATMEVQVCAVDN